MILISVPENVIVYLFLLLFLLVLSSEISMNNGQSYEDRHSFVSIGRREGVQARGRCATLLREVLVSQILYPWSECCVIGPNVLIAVTYDLDNK